jgi:hypothetical protein
MHDIRYSVPVMSVSFMGNMVREKAEPFPFYKLRTGLCRNPHPVLPNALLSWDMQCLCRRRCGILLSDNSRRRYYTTIAKRRGGFGGQALSHPIIGDSQMFEI